MCDICAKICFICISKGEQKRCLADSRSVFIWNAIAGKEREFNYLPVPTDLHSEWLIKVKESLPSTGAWFVFPSACGGSVLGLAAWPYYKLIETLFQNTKVNISSHVIPISLQWIPLNRGYWMANSMLLLEFPMGRSCSVPGKWERVTWSGGQHGDGRKEGWVFGAATAPESTCNMRNFIKGSLWEWMEWKENQLLYRIYSSNKARHSLGLWYVTITFSYEVYGLQTSAPCPGEETFFSRAGKAMVCHAGCHAGFGSNKRLYQLIFTDHRRGKEKNLSLKSAGHNENQHSRSLQWHMIAHHWLSVRRCLSVFRAELFNCCTDPDFVTIICCLLFFFEVLILMNNSRR